jgi:hypothetical protein
VAGVQAQEEKRKTEEGLSRVKLHNGGPFTRHESANQSLGL